MKPMRLPAACLLALLLISCKQYVSENLLQYQKTPEVPDIDLQIFNAAQNTIEMEEINLWLTEYLMEDSNTPILLYLHGMGTYPKKFFRRKAFDRLNKTYNVHTFLVNWSSWLNLYTIPKKNAQLSSQYFLDSLKLINNTLKQTNKKPKIFLIVHSLGGEMFSEMMKNYAPNTLDNFLDSILLINPDTPLKGHEKWLEKVDFAKSIGVFVNTRDTVLEFDKIKLKKPLLGMDFLPNKEGIMPPAAKNADYFIMGGTLQTEDSENYTYNHWRMHTPQLFGHPSVQDLLRIYMHQGAIGTQAKPTAFENIYLFE